MYGHVDFVGAEITFYLSIGTPQHSSEQMSKSLGL